MQKLISVVFYLIFSPLLITAQINKQNEEVQNQYTPKEERKVHREQERKNFTRHFYVSLYGTSANVSSYLQFERQNGILAAKLSLERHLGLGDRKLLLSGGMIYRITPRSGLYGSYYGLKRGNNYELQRDLVFLGDSLKKGDVLSSYFNTNVLSIGYVYSVLREEKAFLGAYFNVYLMNMKTGFNSNSTEIAEAAAFLAPVPNFGIVAVFDLNKRLTLSGGAGLFFLSSTEFGGSFHDLRIMLSYNPAEWLGLVIGYHIFDVTVNYMFKGYMTGINYNYRGPTLGLIFRF